MRASTDRRWVLGWLGLLPFAARGQPDALHLRSAAQAGAPFKYGSAASARPGLCLEIAQAVGQGGSGLRIVGLDREVTLRRLELLLEQGELDVFFCLLRSERRLRMMRYLPVPLYRVRHVLAMRMEDMDMPRTLDELREVSRRRPVLVAQGTQLAQTLKDARVNHVEEAKSDREALQMLLRGRADLVYGQEQNLRALVREAQLEALLRVGTQAFAEEFQYAVVSRQLPESAVQRLLQRLRQLEASGELARIVRRYD
ncbi:transporter substrate-binding domain-containing protein [Pelomonas sp. CA6]|uniref:transporter substrate-binding domain-containing protein n=1 Tax=Pelomonas sp. CA6 TaxID=2907999 RepID=UPI001F4A8E48|nr:transporter substrate-binding domain-containing protein [Pelomonas sp. CA6]MCH7342939.1 transporter substrate-binding domain-containing protein [Pelomonas sp. CA6]